MHTRTSILCTTGHLKFFPSLSQIILCAATLPGTGFTMKVKEICVGHNPNATNPPNLFDGDFRNIDFNGLDVYGGRDHKSRVVTMHPPGGPAVTRKIYISLKGDLDINMTYGRPYAHYLAIVGVHKLLYEKMYCTCPK